MNRTWIIVGTLVVALVLSFSFFTGTYNELVRKDQEISAQWAQVENQLKRRYDLIPNLVNTVKGYRIHEKEIFTQIAEARAKLAGASGLSAKVASANALESALGRLLVVVENYPNLKADQAFIQLQDELAGTENRIAVERMRFNEQVKKYNVYVKEFPRSFLVGLYGFEREKPYFEIKETEKAVPQVQF